MMASNSEQQMLISFDNYYTRLENPFNASKICVYGNNAKKHAFLAYITDIMNGEVPAFNPEMNNWLIEQYHINALHFYAYYNMHKHLSKSIESGACFFPSKSGYTPLSVSIEKKYSECIDAIFEAIRLKSENNRLGFYYFSDSLPALNRTSYPKLHLLYNLTFQSGFSLTMPKFCDDSVDLPIVKESSDLFLTKDKFMDAKKYESEVVAIEFIQSYLKIHTQLGSSGSLEFMKSLIECNNLEVYSAGLIKTILDEKWRTIRWIFITETILYLIYLIFLCWYSVTKSDSRNDNLLIVPFTISIILFLNEIVQMFESRILYFKSFWNYIDIGRFLVLCLFCVLELFDKHREKRDFFLLLTVILSLLRGLSYFRIHSTTRWIVNLIFDIFYQLLSLIFVVAYSILALGVIYRAAYGLGYSSDTTDEEDNIRLQWLLFFFVLILNPIIILNLFVSIVGDAFEKSQDEKIVKDGQELAEMIFEGELLIFWNRKLNLSGFVHVVREEHVEVQAQNTAGQRIKHISVDVVTLNKATLKNRNEIAELKQFVEEKIEEIHSKTEEIFELVKNKQQLA